MQESGWNGCKLFAYSAVVAGVFTVGAASAQTPVMVSTAVLPDAPSALMSGSSSSEAPLVGSLPPAAAGAAMPAGMASRYQVVILPGETAQTLSGKEKFVLGLRDSASPENFLAIVASAGYEQLTNGEPNYGVDRGAFGERLGAAGIRETSQSILSEGVFSIAFKEDPRYYVEGDGHNFFHRTLYAITRPLITRTDSGHATLNMALLTGYAATTAMSYAYYPKINQNPHDMASAFAGSIGGSALGFFVNEFSDEFFEAIHLKKRQ